MLEDEFAVARFMAIELKDRLARDERLKQRFMLNEREARHVPTVHMQEIEGVINEPDAALAVGRRLGAGEAWQSSLVDAAELAVKIGGLHSEVRKRGDDARIFVSPVKPGPCEKLRAAIFDARGHAIAVD